MKSDVVLKLFNAVHAHQAEIKKPEKTKVPAGTAGTGSLMEKLAASNA